MEFLGDPTEAPCRSIGKNPSARDHTTTDCQEHVSKATLKTFTYFPKLPKELRDKIWRGAFPDPANVDLRPSTISKNWQKLPNLLLPVTLRVNRESRQETLRHYDVFFLPFNVPGQKPARPLCFAPTIDSVHFCCSTSFPIWSPMEGHAGRYDKRHDWVPIIQSKNPRFLNTIEDLLIDLPHVHENALSLNTLLNLSGLKNVCLEIEPELWKVMHYHAVKDPKYPIPEHMRFFERVRKRIATHFETHRNCFTGGRVPEVVCPALHSCDSESCVHLSMLETTYNP